MTKYMTTALQQGYPIDPIKYQSDSEYIERVRQMAEEAQGTLNMREELILLRTHLQELEMLWRGKDKDGNGLTMKTARGSSPMTDDVKIDRLVKLTEAISKLSRDTYTITENDYVALSEVKVWLWEIWRAIERNVDKMIMGELNPNDLKHAIQNDFKEIPTPRGGRKS